jgi:hypothetical protein
VSAEIKPSTKEDILNSRDVERGFYEIFKPFNIKHIVFKNIDPLSIEENLFFKKSDYYLNIEKNITFLMIELVKIFGCTSVSLKFSGRLFDWIFKSDHQMSNFGSLSDVLE